MTASSFTIVRDESDKPLVIRDTGGANNRTVTNDAEAVVSKLHAQGLLPNGRRLLYYDSDGDPGEIVHKDGEFVGFELPSLEEFQ